MKRRMLTVALAVLLAVLGTGGVLAYVHQADARALAGQKAVTVLVAGGLIPGGTSVSAALQDGMLARQQFPASSVPGEAVRSITPDLSGLVLNGDLQPGQLLLRPTLVTAAQATGALAIPKGMVAVTIALCMPEAVAGYVHAGSQVAVFDTYSNGTLSVQDCGGQHSQTATRPVHTRTVLPRVQVLAIGAAAANAASAAPQAGSSGAFSSQNSSGNPSAQASGPVMVTLAVSQADAERLVQLTEAGLPYLALLADSSQTALDPAPVQLFQP